MRPVAGRIVSVSPNESVVFEMPRNRPLQVSPVVLSVNESGVNRFFPVDTQRIGSRAYDEKTARSLR